MKNLNRHIILIILICLGFFLIPTQSHACSKTSTKTEKSACSKRKTKDLEGKDCCKTNSCKKSKEETGHCSDSCKGKTCTNNTPSPSFALLSHVEICKNYFAETKKYKFGFRETYYSSEFLSIWLPPKIS